MASALLALLFHESLGRVAYSAEVALGYEGQKGKGQMATLGTAKAVTDVRTARLLRSTELEAGG